MNPSLNPDLLAQFFGGKLPFDDEDKAGTPPPGLMMRPPAQPDAAAPPMPITAGAASAPPAALPAIPAAPKLRGPNPDLQQKLATAETPLKRADYKPKWYDWLAGTAVGGLTGSPQAGAGLINRRWNSAQGDQKRNVDSLSQQLEQEDKANKEYNTGQESEFNNQMAVAKEGRERQTSDRAMSYREDMLNLRESMASDKLDQSQKTLALMEERAKTDAGYRMQMLQNAKELLDIREKMANVGGKPATTAESIAIEGRRNKAWNDAHKQYGKDIGMLSPKDTKGQEQARQDYYDARQSAQDEYESAIKVGKGTAEHVELPRNHFGEETSAPAAAPAAQPGAAQPKGAAPKAVAKSVVQSYADSHKMSYQQAEQGFKSKGYTVQ